MTDPNVPKPDNAPGVNPPSQPQEKLAGNTPVAGKPAAPVRPGERAPVNAQPGVAQTTPVQPVTPGTGSPPNQSMSQFTQSDEGKLGSATQPGGQKRAEELPPETGQPGRIIQPGSAEDAARATRPDESPRAGPAKA